MPNAAQRGAVREPIRPKPTISTVLPESSTGSPPLRSCHTPCCMRRFISVPRLASAIMKNTACSATLVEFAVPVTINGMPRAVSAGTSTASNPTPVRATTCNRGAAATST